MIKHLAVIMDGNRRWAKKRLLTPWKGHQEGVEAVQRTIEFCVQKQIRYLSLYTFSLENFKRSEQEKNYLFGTIAKQAYKRLPELIKQGVRVCFIGDRALFPKDIVPTVNKVEEQTKHLDRLQVNLLFCYGAQQEIAHAVKKLFSKIKSGAISEDQLSAKLLSEHLWTHGIPEPDLIIRTGGRKRLSNFLLFQAAYSELYFLDCLWPDIRQQDLEHAIYSFEEIQRNHGV